jgi:hypothetical protein
MRATSGAVDLSITALELGTRPSGRGSSKRRMRGSSAA